MYRVQNDKGWLFIYATINGKRKKIDLRRILFNAGTVADYIFNGWFEQYEYEQFKAFAENEINSI
jgi:hypothetical protein